MNDETGFLAAALKELLASTAVILATWGALGGATNALTTKMRLRDALRQQAFSALSTSPGARAFYDAHRDAGDGHDKALRALANRLVGILHGCLKHHTAYDEHTAWGHRTPASAAA